MSRILPKLKTFIPTVLSVLVFIVPFLAQAADNTETFFGTVARDVLFSLVVSVTGFFLWLGGLLLDAGIEIFLVGFGNTYVNTGVGEAIDSAWVIIRDTMNLFFIFGLVYIGFKMILETDNANTRRWLINLIIAALLINFSLFITKAVIDASNLISTQIAVSGLGAKVEEDGVKLDLSATMFEHMGIANVLNTGRPEGSGWAYIFGTGILFMVTAFVFAAGGVLLILRFAMLCFYLVLSPVMFASWILPSMKDSMNKYWSGFLSKAFWPPVYLFFIYLTLQIIGGLQRSVGGSGASNIANPRWDLMFKDDKSFQSMGGAGDAVLGTLPFFVLICFFMIMSLIMAQKIGADGAGKALSIGKNLRYRAQRAAGSATFGAVGVVGQNTFGRGARALAKTQGFQNFAARSKVGRAALEGTRKVADASFDARRVNGFGKELGIGEGKKGGFESRVKEKVKKDEEFMKSLDDADMKEPENQAKAAAIAATEVSEGNLQINAAESELKNLDAIVENSGKSFVELNSEIANLTKNLEDYQKTYTEKEALGGFTTQEKVVAEKAMADTQRAIEGKRVASWEAQKIKMFEDKIKANNIKDTYLQSKISQTNDVEEKKRLTAEATAIREEREQFETELAERKDVDRRRSKAETNKGLAQKRIKDAEKTAKNEVKFASKIAFMDNVKKGIDKVKADESLENLQKKYGKDADEMESKKAKSKAEKDAFKALAAAQKEVGGSEEKEGKKEGDA